MKRDPFTLGLIVSPMRGEESAAAAIDQTLRTCRAAYDKHGALPLSYHAQLTILTEEVGEAAEAINRHTYVEPCHEAILAELADVAATALRMMEAIRSTTITPLRHAA